MKKLQIVILFAFLVGCSSSPNRVPTANLEIEQTPDPAPTQSAVPPTETPVPTGTFTPPPTATAIGGAGKIAFTSEGDGVPDIYLINSDGTNLTRLANEITPKFNPAWSPDGRKIAFGSNTNDAGHFYIMNADGSNLTKLINTKDIDNYAQAPPNWRFAIGCCTPVWSPDGKKVALGIRHYVGGGLSYGNIYVINVDGSDLISIADHPSQNFGSVWSPDSQRIAFGGVSVMNADGTNLVELTQKERSSSPTWSPDGKKIAFAAGWGGDAKIYVMNADGTDLVNLTRYGSSWDHGPVWSPDGKKIAFTSYRDGNYEIYLINADGTDLVNLTKNPADDDGTVWSPDSTKIAFISGRDGNSEIYVMDADGSNLIRLTNNNANDYSPVWSP